MNDTIEQINLEYLKTINSKEYKLGRMLIEIFKAMKVCDIRKIKKEMKPLINSIKLNKYTNHAKRFQQVKSTDCHEKLVVYMALFGEYDRVYEPMVIDSRCEYYIFTDQKINEKSVWKKVELSDYDKKIINGMSNYEKNRYFKILGYRKLRRFDGASYDMDMVSTVV